MRLLPTQTMSEVGDGIFAVEHGQGEVGVSNAAFVVVDGQTLLIDTTLCSATAEGVERQIRRHGRLRSVVLTHYHIDHIGGAERFASRGVPILAAPEGLPSIQRMQQTFSPQKASQIMPQFRDELGKITFPQLALLTQEVLPSYGGEAHIFQAAHTPADLAVWFPASRVLVSGDLGFFGVTPLCVDGLISGWIDALEELMALEPLVVIPGHGPIGSVHDLRNLRDYFLYLQAVASQVIGYRLSAEEVLMETLGWIQAGPMASWLEPQRHTINFERAIQEALGEISPTQLLPRPSSAEWSGTLAPLREDEQPGLKN